jgi:hypothetical protein
VSAVLLTVENNEVHVVSSECAVPISAVGKTEPGVCTQACRLNGLSLSFYRSIERKITLFNRVTRVSR